MECIINTSESLFEQMSNFFFRKEGLLRIYLEVNGHKHLVNERLHFVHSKLNFSF